MVCRMGGMWLYSCCLVGCCFHDVYITSQHIHFTLLYNHFTTYSHNIITHPLNIALYSHNVTCPVGWGCRIHRLHLCTGVRHPHPTTVLDMTLNNLMVKL